MSDCLVCGTEDKDKPMIMRGTDWCGDRHRKVIAGELPATYNEVQLMDNGLFQVLHKAKKLEHVRGL